MKPFKPPKDTRVCLQYMLTKQDGSKELLGIVTESTMRTGSFTLYLPDGDTWRKAKTCTDPDFDKEVFVPNAAPKTKKH